MNPKATYTGSSHAWHGAIKVNGKMVWRCGHNHHSRDQGGVTWGRSARGCAESVLTVALKSDAEIEQMRRDMHAYNMGGMGTRMPWKAEYELGVREEVRRALGVARMTPTQLSEARRKLGLSLDQMAAVLGYEGEQARSQVHHMETGRRDIRPAQRRLVQAYLAGYRPEDWPL